MTLRPAPDTMTLLTALLPVKQGVAAYAALTKAADSARAQGDERSRGQLMADTLVERVTGQASAGHVPVEVQLVISDQTLAGADDQTARVVGHGPVPAPWARDLVRNSRAEVWVRRLYTGHGRLVAMESTRRLFPDGLRRFIVARDQSCRTPWCDAPIRHIDHPVPADAGGETSEANGQGLCEACNHTKQATGWRARPGPSGAGSSWRSRPPRGTGTPPGHRPLRARTVRVRSWRRTSAHSSRSSLRLSLDTPPCSAPRFR